jgi:hypothetical protein
MKKNDVKMTIIPLFVYDFAIFVVILHPVNRYEPAKGSYIATFGAIAQPGFDRVQP